jgi:hypothetical protein
MVFRHTLLQALVASSLAACATVASAQVPSNQDLIGTWNLTMTSPQGSHPTVVVISEESGQLKGSISGMPTVGGVTVSSSEAGARIAFAVDYQGQAIDVVMVGKIDGTSIKGTVDYASGAAAGDFSGSKAGATTTAAAAGGSVAGAWDVTGSSGGGYSFNLAQEGTAVTGVLKTPDGAEIPVKGTFENNALTLAVAADAMSGTIKGVLEGAGLKGGYDIGGNAGSWTATRKP